MRTLIAALTTLAIPLAACSESPTVPSVAPAIEVHTDCPAEPLPEIIDIKDADPAVDQIHHDEMLKLLIEKVRKANTTIRLGPNVVLDFSKVTDPGAPLQFGQCVTLTSVSSFGSGKEPMPQARSPQSLGPLLRFGPRRKDVFNFIEVWCEPDGRNADGARISGFRIHGPSFGQQTTDENGIKIFRCTNIEISNMDIAGWGGSAIRVEDELGHDQGPADNPSNGPGPRISHVGQVKIFNNFIHHNQHPSEGTIFGGHAAGYGVDVSHGAWALISENVFDFNRHAIQAAGDSGGYDAIRNLALKGGGYHGMWYSTYTHMFDVHGTGCWWSSNLCGYAGTRFLYQDNAFQYRNGHAIKIRGLPLSGIYITGNVFPHDGLEDDWGDDAIHLYTSQYVNIGPGNVIEFDTYGRYGVCDFDGDRFDDLFLPTRASWWYSSFGELHWSYLNDAKDRLDHLRLGYFDDDLNCDVLAESGREWVISSGGKGPWTSIGAFGKPLNEVAFGQFNPDHRDHRPGATRRTTHAFWRAPDGQWFITALSAPDWQPVQSSSVPMNKLRFGDFTGDGVTDVLAVSGGRWAISESARGPWRNLNPHLSNDVSSLFIADLDNNNIDDIIRLEIKRYMQPGGVVGIAIATWFVSDDGRSKWRELKKHSFQYNVLSPPLFGFAGRFGAAPGAGVLLTDPGRFGRFFSEAEAATGVSPDWSSLFPY